MKNTAVRWSTPLMVILLVVGCTQNSQVVSELQQKPYFDLPTLVEQQLFWLDSLNPSVVLHARIGTQTEQETVRKDSAAWAETLQLFQQTDINRPVLQGEYEESDSVLQDQNLRVKTYRHRRNNASEIPYLKVYYRDSLVNVQRIETAFQEDNVLYSTRRSMWMTFTPYQGKPRLTAFETVGKQKMMLRDSVTYVARGEMQYD